MSKGGEEMNKVTDNHLYKKPHKFFKETLNNDLKEMLIFAKEINDGIKAKTGYDMENAWKDEDANKNIAMDSWHVTYNIFTYENDSIQKIQNSIKEMVKNACEYYDIDMEEQKYMLKGHLNYYAGPKMLNRVDPVWDNHGDNPLEFHGYYCINAEPSITYYKVDNQIIENKNKNNTSLLSQNGYHHVVGDWPYEDVRVTIGYNVFPFKNVPENQENIPVGATVHGWDPKAKEYTSTTILEELSFGKWISLF